MVLGGALNCVRGRKIHGFLRRGIHQSTAVSRQSPPPPLNLFVSCLPGLENILSSELNNLGLVSHKITKGGVELPNRSVDDILDCHLYLGTAAHVLLRCGEPFRARGFPELKRKVERIEWGNILSDHDTLQLDIRVSATKSKLFHTGAVAERIRESIQACVGAETISLSDEKSPKAENTVHLAVRVERDLVQISLDTSQTPLHRRGYRLQPAKAPLREDLAYALLYSAGCRGKFQRTNENSKDRGKHYDGIMDPFCGSGTIAIEGACMLAGLPPGRLRPAPLRGTRFYSPSKWAEMVQVASARNLPCSVSSVVSASDRDRGACETTMANAERAGVLDLLDIQRCAVSSNPWFEEPDKAPESILIATNPPFGKRMGRSSELLLPVYQRFGQRVISLSEAKSNVTAVILAHEHRLARSTAIPDLKVAFATNHGGTPVSALVAAAKTR